MIANLILGVYVTLLVVGGWIGYRKAGSKISLITSALFAVLLVLAQVLFAARHAVEVLLVLLLVVFGARYANVQPMSASAANEIVLFSVLEPGDTLLGMELDAGGHLSHGSKASLSGQVFHALGYGLTKDERIDYEQAERLASSS